MLSPSVRLRINSAKYLLVPNQKQILWLRLRMTFNGIFAIGGTQGGKQKSRGVIDHPGFKKTRV